MELRTYLAILRRRLWIVALVFGVVLIYVGYQYYTDHKAAGSAISYTSTINIRVGLQAPAQNAPSQSYADYASTSEVLADQFASGPIINTVEFGQQVSNQIQNDMPAITQKYGSHPELGNWQDPHVVAAALKATHTHTLVTISTTWDTSTGAWAIAHAAGEVSQKHIAQYLDYEVRSKSLSDHPLPAAEIITDATQPTTSGAPASKTKLLLAMLIVGLIIGIALAFLVEYLDDHIRNSEDAVRMLQLPIYGEIPRAPMPGQTKSRR